jgi:hypothetical protein
MAHIIADLVDQIDGAGDIGINDPTRAVKVLIEESVSEATSRIC